MKKLIAPEVWDPEWDDTLALARAAVKAIEAAAALVKQADDCAFYHYCEDYREQGKPGWLLDAEAKIDDLRDALFGVGFTEKEG